MTVTHGACPRRDWGSTGLSIPVIPFGTQGFGDNFGPVSQDEAFALIRRAVDLGVNHFDCARCYGNSLQKLGAAIKSGVVRRDEIVVSGRLCCHSAAPSGGYGQGAPDYSAERAIADIESQLELLGTEYLDAVLIHDPGDIGPPLAPGGTLEGLERLKAEGRVRNVGFGMRPHPFHLAAIHSGRVDVMLTFGDYNLLRQTAAAELLSAAAERGIGVLNGWSIMRGLLTGTPVAQVTARDHWLNAEDARRAEAMRLWCRDHGISLLALALQFCLRDRRIHGNPLGSLNIDQLEENVEAAATPLDESVFEAFRASGLATV